MSRFRILCLHGFTSNGAVHTHQLRRLTSQLPEFDFLFPDGVHQVDINQQMDMTKSADQAWSNLVLGLGSAGHRAWWFARDGEWKSKTTGGFYGIEQTLEYLGAYMADKGPVHAIWGFSQGACLAAMLCSLLEPKLASHPLRQLLPDNLCTPMAGVIFCGFRARFEQYDSIYERGIDIPMLHVLGENDLLVRSERSEALIQTCKQAESLRHGDGHNIPKDDSTLDGIATFIRSTLVGEKS